MYRPLCMLLLPLATIALASSPPSAPGEAAKSLSFMAVNGAKLAIANQMKGNPHISQTCVKQLDNYALASTFETVLEQQLTKTQLDNANKYYATPLAKQYTDFRLQQLSSAMGNRVYNPVNITPLQLNTVTAFGASDTGIALNNVNSNGNHKSAVILLPAIKALFAHCWK